MENEKKYLEKVLIYTEQTMIAAYRPTIDKNICQQKKLEHTFKKIDINKLLTIKNTKDIQLKSNTLIKKCRTRKKHHIRLENIDLKLFKNKKYDEFILFLTHDYNINNIVYLELFGNPRKTENASSEISVTTSQTNKSKKRPLNYAKLIGFEKMFEETIKSKLFSSLNLNKPNIMASAIFRTNNKERNKEFFTQDIKTEKDIHTFLQNLNKRNTFQHKFINPNLNVENVRAFIVLNKNKKELYLELTNYLRKKLNREVLESQIIEYDNKNFINANLLKIKLHNLKLYTSKTIRKPLKIEETKSTDFSAISSNTNSLISINEYSFHNIYDLIKQYEENITSNYISSSRSCDNIIKETYRMLVELQLNAIEQCNKLYFNYFNNKNCWSDQQSKFTSTMKNNYSLLLKLQNKAIENSVFVNKRIKNVNKFINKISETTRSSSATNCSMKIPRNPTSISDYKIRVSVSNFDQNSSRSYLSSELSTCTSTITIIQRPIQEIEVQTSFKDVRVFNDVIKLNKCCSPINIMDKKGVQTDISVNKNTSIDYGGQSVQICKRNINLKPRNVEVKLKNVEKPKISASEEDILKNLTTAPKILRNYDKTENLTEKTPKKMEDNLKIPSVKPEANHPEIEEAEEATDEAKSFSSDLEDKMKKLSVILKKIQDEYKPQKEDLLFFTASTKKLQTIPEEPKEEPKLEPKLEAKLEPNSEPKPEPKLEAKLEPKPEPKVEVKKHEVLFHIKNTLERVKERFEKNSQILKKVTNLKDNYMITTNMKKLVESGGIRQGDFPGKPKFLKMPVTELKSMSSSSSTVKSVKQTKVEIAKNLNTSLQLLKNLNEVTKNIKSNPNTAMIKLSEIEESIQFQRRLTPKYKCEKSHLTLTPIKNFIASNKMKVSNNATRLSNLKLDKSKKPRVMPSINSKHILDLTRQKHRRRSRPKCQTVPSTKSIQKQPIHPTIQTTHEQPLIPKIYRPISPRLVQLDTSKLSNLTLNDVAPFQPEYPRKDNLAHIEVEKTYLYKLLNNSFSEKSLEPLIKCSNSNCTSCTNVYRANKKTDKVQKKRKDILSKTDQKTESQLCVWEKMHWNTEITIQQDHDFDFKQFMKDPNLERTQEVTVCPVNVMVNSDTVKGVPKSLEKNLKDLQDAMTSIRVSKTTAVVNPPGNDRLPLNKNILAAKANQNKIQKSIQQAIMKNQEKFKFIEQSLTPKHQSNTPKFKKNIPVKTPKIISSGTLNNKKVLWTKLSPQFSKRNELFLQRQQNARATKDDNVFDRKYKENLSLTSAQSSKTTVEDGVLQQISQTVKQSQNDMQKYIELVEQKFIKTFSLPETEKATAYTNLESEIKDMLHLLNTSKDKRRSLECPTPKSKQASRSGSASVKSLKKSGSDKPKSAKTPRPSSKTLNKTPSSKNQVKRSPSTPKKQEKTPSNLSVIVIKEPNKNNFASGSEVAMDKKKTSENSQPTICRDSINFLDSLTAIISKQNLLFPTQPTKSLSILKSKTVDNQSAHSSSTNNKKVRFKLDNVKVTKSDSTVVTISTDEEYSTLCEETASDFSSSDQELTNIIHTKMFFVVTVHVKLTYFIVHPTYFTETYYIVNIYQNISLNNAMPENYDLKIICNNDFDTFDLTNISDLLEPTEIVYKSDSLSDFIENCEELIEATKKLELNRKKSSPEILEFLDIITSISLEHLGLKKETYYLLTRFDSFPQYQPQIYFLCDSFHPIFFKNNPEVEIITKTEQKPHELGPIVSKSQLIQFETFNELIKKNTVSFENYRLHKHFSQPNFTNDLLNYHIKIPFCKELVKCPSDSNSLDVLTYNSRRRLEPICQTLVLNLQVQNYGHKKVNFHKDTRKTIQKKCYVLPVKNKLQLKAIEVDFDFNKNKILPAPGNYEKLLIFLYITLFSFAFLCITLNYKCE